MVPNSRPSTAQRKAKFVANLQRLMRPLRLSVRETARRAGIVDKKRFYRWANNGIARAAHEHDEDLERLRKLFRLSSIEQLWGDLPDASPTDMVLAVAEEDPDFIYAYRVLVALRGLDNSRADNFKTLINDAFEEATREVSAEDILAHFTPEQMLDRLRIRDPAVFEKLMMLFRGRETKLHSQLAAILHKRDVDPIGRLIAASVRWPSPT